MRCVQKHIESTENPDIADLVARIAESLADTILNFVPEEVRRRVLAHSVAHLGEMFLQRAGPARATRPTRPVLGRSCGPSQVVSVWRNSHGHDQAALHRYATATGGRDGHTQANDGSVSADLSVPKAMGGPGKPGTTTPEHLSPPATPPASAEHSTSSASSTRRMPEARITADVSIGPREGGGFGLAVKLRVEDLDFTASGARGARQGSAREDLPVFARHARQRRCAGRGEGRSEHDHEKWKPVFGKDHARPRYLDHDRIRLIGLV